MYILSIYGVKMKDLDYHIWFTCLFATPIKQLVTDFSTLSKHITPKKMPKENLQAHTIYILILIYTQM